MKFAFRELTLHVYHSITPVQMMKPAATTEQIRNTILALAGNTQLAFLEEYFMAGSPQAQASCVQATAVMATSLCDKLEKYLSELDLMELPEGIRRSSIEFYQDLSDQIKDLLIFLQYHFSETGGSVPIVNSDVQLQTTLSVGQLGVLLRLLADSGIIKAVSHTQLIKHAANTFTTQRSNSISFESLRNKFYSPDEAALSIMHTHITKMLSLLSDYRHQV